MAERMAREAERAFYIGPIARRAICKTSLRFTRLCVQKPVGQDDMSVISTFGHQKVAFMPIGPT
jgi:hypothetical protein